MPRMIEAAMAKKSAKNLIPNASLKIFNENTRPNPVREITPITMPAQAQAIATDIVPFTPFSSARQNRLSVRRLLFLKKLTTIAIRMESQAA